MFRELRRKKQALSPSDCAAVLDRGTSGVLALSGDGGYPYAVPLSYVSAGDKLYFHSAKAGHKLDAIARDRRASFCVVDQDRIVPSEFTSYFRSVIVFGTVRPLEDEGEKRRAMELLSLKYAPESTPEARAAVLRKEWDALCVLELSVEHVSGKEAIELVRANAPAPPEA